MSLEGPQVEKVCCDQVFNLPLFEGFLVIDVRVPSEFEKGHITGAINLPASEPFEKAIERLLELIVLDLYTPSRWDSVVLYGSGPRLSPSPSSSSRPSSSVVDQSHDLEDGNVEDDQEQVDRAARMFSHLVLAGASDKTSSGAQDAKGKQIVQTLETICFNKYVDEVETLKRFLNTFSQRCKRVWTIEGGYRAFSLRYPLLTTLLTPNFEMMLPTPARVSEHVFIGTRSLCIDQQLAHSLGIRAVIQHDPTEVLEIDLDTKTPRGEARLRDGTDEVMTATEQKEYQRVYDEMCRRQIPGVEILYCRGSTELHRRSSGTYRETIMTTWTQAVDYIEKIVSEADRRVQEGESSAILIMFEGRQRSLSIATAWRALREGISVDEALQAFQKQIFSLNIKRSPLLDLDYMQSWLDERRKQSIPLA